MAHMVSFAILVIVILLIGGLFVMVMSQFLLPMFLALLLVVLFRPVHQWILKKCRGRAHLAAGLTTTAIALIVLMPMLLIFGRAGAEGVALATATDPHKLQQDIMKKGGRFFDDARSTAQNLGIDIPPNEELIHTTITTLQGWIAPAALRTTQFVGRFLFGLAIMLISLYFFLADGPSMVDALMRFSPLDDRYEQQLLEEFVLVSRAVVMATLLAALGQGILSGIAYLAVGMHSVFLLTVLTMVLALVPFVGATAVWLPCSLWLYFYEERTTAAVFLAVWGFAVVSLVDNLIKPYILHGQSNLHPLLALLSVWGGIQTLGPIGIFVGPMVVSFLQALLNIFRMELQAMDTKRAAVAVPPVI